VCSAQPKGTLLRTLLSMPQERALTHACPHHVTEVASKLVLSSSDPTQMARELFKQIDVNGDGTLDRSEIAGLATRLGKTLSEADLTAAMSEMDVRFAAWPCCDSGTSTAECSRVLWPLFLSSALFGCGSDTRFVLLLAAAICGCAAYLPLQRRLLV